MKNVFFASLILLISTVSFAQIVTVQWGEHLNLNYRYCLQSSLGIEDGKLYANSVRYNMPKGVFEQGIGVVDTKTLKLVSNTTCEVSVKKTKLVCSHLIKGTRWLFTRNTADKIDYIKAYPLDKIGAVIDKPIVLARFKSDKKTIFNYTDQDSIRIIQSSDSTKVGLIICPEKDSKKKRLYALSVFDTDFNEQWSEVIELPYSQDRFAVHKVSMTNTGEFQVIGKLYENEKAQDERGKTEPNFKYIIRTYSDKNRTGKEYPIDLGSKFAEDVCIKTRPDNGNTIIMGMYTNKTGVADDGFCGINGFYYFEFTPNGTVANEYTKEIDATKIKNLSKNLLTKEKILAPHCKVVDVFFKKDGSMLLATEFLIAEWGINNGSSLDNIIFNLEPNGAIKWGVSVPKSEGGGYPKFQGTKLIFRNDNLFLIYNDVEKNLKHEPNGNTEPFNVLADNSIIVAALVNSEGQLTRKALTNKKESENYVFSPEFSEFLDNGDLIFVATKLDQFEGFKTKAARLTFNEWKK